MAFHEHAALQFAAYHHGWHERQPRAFTGEQAQHRHVVHFGRDDRADVVQFEQEVESCANVAVEARQNQWHVPEVIGELEFRPPARRRTNEADRLLVEEVAVPGRLRVAAHGQIRKHGVERVGPELRKQVAKVSGMQNEFDIGATKKRLEERNLEIARERRDRTQTNHPTLARSFVAQHAHHFLARAKDGFRVFQSDPSGFGENEGFVLPKKEGLPETLLEAAQLNAQGRLRNIQPFGRSGKRALGRDGSEIAQMMVVQEGHGVLLAKRTITLKRYIGTNTALSATDVPEEKTSLITAAPNQPTNTHAMRTTITLALTASLAFATTSPAEPATPADWQRLLAGNARFVAGTSQHPHQNSVRRTETASGQKPFAIVVGCADSRTSPELLFDQGIGDLFVVRLAGNIVDDAALGSVEFAVAKLGAKLIVVLGHEKCGAVSAAVDAVKGAAAPPGHIGAVVEAIKPAAASVHGQAGDAVENAVKANVRNVVERLKNASPVLAPHLKSGELSVVGAHYDLDDGKVEQLP